MKSVEDEGQTNCCLLNTFDPLAASCITPSLSGEFWQYQTFDVNWVIHSKYQVGKCEILSLNTPSEGSGPAFAVLISIGCLLHYHTFGVI